MLAACGQKPYDTLKSGMDTIRISESKSMLTYVLLQTHMVLSKPQQIGSVQMLL
jgi:hypothetical protein